MTDASTNPEAASPHRPPAAPLFAATVLFSAGIVLQNYVYKPPALYLLCAVGLALCSWLALRLAGGRRGAVLAYGAAVLAFFPAGALLTAAAGSQPSAAPTILNYANGDEVTLTGYVARSGSLRAGRDVHESLDFAAEEAQFDGDAARAVTGSARLNLYVPGSRSGFDWDTEEEGLDEAASPPVFDYGQRLRIRARLRPPTNFRNPGDMDYVGWLRGQGVAVLGSAKSTDVHVLEGAGGSRMERARWRARRSALEHMARLWPAPYAALLQAMVLGERGLVGREQRLEFQRSGTFHLLVVSGMNVAIFAVFLLWLMRRLRLPVEYAIVATIAITCGYAWLTELGVPILRSVLMIVAYQIAVLLNRERAPLNTVSLAALVLLVFSPDTLFDPSFQLTFIAVLTIAGLAVPLMQRTTTPLREALDDLEGQRHELTLAPAQRRFRGAVRELTARLGRVMGTRAAHWLTPQVLLRADCAGRTVHALRTDAGGDHFADDLVLSPGERARAMGQHGGASTDRNSDASLGAGGGVFLCCNLDGGAVCAGRALVAAGHSAGGSLVRRSTTDGSPGGHAGAGGAGGVCFLLRVGIAAGAPALNPCAGVAGATGGLGVDDVCVATPV